jgi:hypothetical protein
MKMPALLIRVSIRPNREIACPTTASAVAGTPTSPRTATISRSPVCSIEREVATTR